MGVEFHVSFVCVRACILPSGDVNVTPNKLLDFNDKNARDGCRVSLAQVVRALSPRCLPWILPSSATLVFSAQVVCNVNRSSFGTVTTYLRWFG